MLNNEHFYFKLLRKYVILFGNMFNNLILVRTQATDTDIEVQRIKVPLTYAPKDKYVTRLTQDPDLLKPVGSILPRMSFEIQNFAYDPARKQLSTLRAVKGDTTTAMSAQYMGVPYNIHFELNIYAKTIDDANQILEQILPYFTPDYTYTITPVPELAYLKDIPIVLNSVNQNITYEGDWNSVRYVSYTLLFTVKGYFFGPIETPKIIRKSIANIFNDPSLVTGYTIRINTNQGNNGTFQISDTVYQGNNFTTATAFATVLKWNQSTHKLLVSGAQGNFTVNSTIKSVSTNASYIIESFDASPLKLVNITVEPSPNTAQPGEDFGYTETIIEFPDTLE